MSGQMRDGEKESSPNLTQRLRRSPLSRRARAILDDGFCDFAFGSAQNDKVGGKLRRLKIFGLNKPIKRERESGAVFIGY